MENINEQQLTIYDELYEEVKITKPIRLIELFAGYGSQAMALERLGVDFTHHKVIEFDRFAVNSYNAVHGTDFKVTDIRDIHAEDLEVTYTDKYCYIMTYSFPCTDLSVAGKMKGMKKGSGTRSGLLWEVERLLKEMDEKPQVLLMENVPQVHGKKNKEDFQSWISFLESVGYRNYWQDLNAKNYGVAQNRNRCFMVSLLGNYSYDFPQPIPLKKKLKDYLEDNVDEKYYINNEKADKLIKQFIDNGTLPQHNLDRQTCVTEQSISRSKEKSQTVSRQDMTAEYQACGQTETWLLKDMGETADKKIDVAVTLRARDYKGFDNYGSNGVIEVMAGVNVIGSLEAKLESTNRIYDVGGCSPTLSTMQGGNQEPKILEEQIPCKLNKMPEGHLDSLDNAKICDVDTPTASTVTSRYYKGIGAHKDNMCIVAMRGRNPDNPSDRTVGSPTEQRLEVNMQGTSNCLTSVQKDNLVMESQVLTPKRTEYGKQIRKAYESGQIQESRHNMTELEPRQDNVSNTLTTVQKDNLVLEKPQYRIRKLTPRECGRLMGVSDEDIDKMSAVNSNTQLYKQFGNSIVVDVLCAIFKQLNIEQEKEN